MHRHIVRALVVVLAAAVTAAYAQTPAPAAPSLVGAWTLNKDLSDQSQSRSGGEGRDGGSEGRRDGGGAGRRGGGRGFGGGGFGRGGSGAQGRNPEDAERLRNALRDEMQAPDRLTITQSETTVIITAGDGRTTRLSVDGKKIRDESTRIERKTKWDGGKLVSEISGLGQGKIIETYNIDAERKQLHVTLMFDGSARKDAVNRVYDADPK